MFTWIPKNVSSPNSAYNTDYILELWEIPKVGINRDAEFISNTLKPYASISVSDQYNYIYTIMDPILKDGYKYSWRVTAKDRSGRDYFQNGGKSNINTFEFIDITLHPNALMAPKVKICEIRCEEDYYSAVVKWRKQAVYTKYKVYYTTAENTGSKRLYEEITEGDSLEITKLGTNTQWEYWVNGLTSDSLEGPECEHRLFTTKNYAKAFGCDVEPPKHPKPKGYKKEYAKIPRIKVLEAGEEIELKVGVLKIFSATRDSDSSYSGDCAHSNPFGLRGFINCRYRKLKVNEYNQMITGEIVFKSDLDGKFNKMQELIKANKQLDSVRRIRKQIDFTIKEEDELIYDEDNKRVIVIQEDGTQKFIPLEEEIEKSLLQEAMLSNTDSSNNSITNVKDSLRKLGKKNIITVIDKNGTSVIVGRSAIKKINTIVEFEKTNGSKYGFDENKIDKYIQQYNTSNKREIRYVSVLENGTEEVKMIIYNALDSHKIINNASQNITFTPKEIDLKKSIDPQIIKIVGNVESDNKVSFMIDSLKGQNGGNLGVVVMPSQKFSLGIMVVHLDSNYKTEDITKILSVADIQHYLNNIVFNQVNVTFNVQYLDSQFINWDKDKNRKLTIPKKLSDKL